MPCRSATQKKLHAAQVRRQKEFLRSIGVPDLSPEEVTRESPPPADDDLVARLEEAEAPFWRHVDEAVWRTAENWRRPSR